MNTILSILDNSLYLTSVQYEATDKLVWTVRLSFGAEVVVVSVDQDSDALVISGGRDARDPVVDKSNSCLWKRAVGYPLYAAWEMTSHQGYIDGLQLQFAQTSEDRPVTIQLLGAASMVQVQVVEPVSS